MKNPSHLLGDIYVILVISSKLSSYSYIFLSNNPAWASLLFEFLSTDEHEKRLGVEEFSKNRKQMI